MQLSDQENIYGKQARTLLLLDKGLNIAEMSLFIKIPEQDIKTLYSRFEKKGFSSSLLALRKMDQRNSTFRLRASHWTKVKKASASRNRFLKLSLS